MEKRLIILLLVPFLIFWHWFEPAARKNLKGIKSYHEKKYEQALNEFLSAKGISPDSPELKSNTASSLYQMKKYKEALEEFSKIDPEKSHFSKSHFYYNMGNSFFKQEQYDKAIENYKKSMIADPQDVDAKKNFELALKKLEEQKDKEQQDKDKNQDKDKDKEKDKDKQNQDQQKQDQQNQDQKKQDQEKQDQQKQEQQQQEQQNKEKNEALMRYLNQNEKDQMKKQIRRLGVVKKEKDW